MSGYDVTCDADEQADGTWTLKLSITGLTLEQAGEISIGLRLPVENIMVAVLNEGNPTVITDLMGLPQ